jgi:hypothetical protein
MGFFNIFKNKFSNQKTSLGTSETKVNNMNNKSSDFQKIDIDLLKSENVKIEYFESNLNASLLLIKIKGKILDGSKGSLDCNFIGQKIGLSLISTTFTAVILDLKELEYKFGNSIIDAFIPLQNVKIGEENYTTAFILSDKNKFGLSTLWCFDIDNPREPIFYNLEDGLKYIEKHYN